jgi:pyruvate dehydrogenase phosphatase
VRLRSEHPNEPELMNVKSRRVLGLAITRAIGDGFWKWLKEFIEECHKGIWGDDPVKGCLSPPYIIAEPVITTMMVKREG